MLCFETKSFALNAGRQITTDEKNVYLLLRVSQENIKLKAHCEKKIQQNKVYSNNSISVLWQKTKEQL